MIILRKKVFSDDYISDATEDYREPETTYISNTTEDYRKPEEIYESDASEDFRPPETNDPVFKDPFSSDAMIN